MASKYWIGGTPKLTYRKRVIPTNVEIGDMFTLTRNGISVSFTATAASVSNVTAGLTSAWNAATHPDLVVITATDGTSYIELSYDVPGVDFTITASATDGAGTDKQTISVIDATPGAAVAQVTQKNVASSTNGETFIVTLAYEDGTTVAVLTHTVDGIDAGNTTTVCSEIVSEFNALTHELAIPITASNSASKLILTADEPGRPFYATFSGTGTWNDTGVSNTANKGPNDWNTADNWSDGAVPAASDTVVIDGRGQASILYGLNQSSITLASLHIRASFSGLIGSARFPLRIGATELVIGAVLDGTSQAGSPAINLDLGSAQTTAFVESTAAQGSGGLPPVMLKGTHASNALHVSGSSYVGVAVAKPGDTATFATITHAGSGTLTIGSGASITDVWHAGSGTTRIDCAVSGTLRNSGTGIVRVRGSGSIATLDAAAGTIYVNNRPAAGATITTLQMRGGTVDFRENAAPATITTTTFDGGKVMAVSATQITHTDGTVRYDAGTGHAG